MKLRFTVTGLLTPLVAGLWVSTAAAAPTLRVQVDQKGDFALIGNTLGYECANGTPNPIVGTINGGNCNQGLLGLPGNTSDSSPDLFWRSGDAGGAVASFNTTPAQARSQAVLAIPAGATVTHAFLYWAAVNNNGTADTAVTLDRTGAGAFTASVGAVKTYMAADNAYQSVADVTSVVQAHGNGAYRVSGIDTSNFAFVNDDIRFAGWSLVVLYQDPTAALRNLTVWDGMDLVDGSHQQTINLVGFTVPAGGFDGKLGVIAYEGDNTLTGDQLFFNPNAGNTNPLHDALNPANNFFNGTRSAAGVAVSTLGDLPQLTGGPQSMAGMDLDIVDISANIAGGQTSGIVKATSTGDEYFLGAFITSITTFRPDFTTSAKTVVNQTHPGDTAQAGDVLRYTIAVTNTGNDPSKNTVVNDVLPNGVTYVPSSLSVTLGPNAGAKTDAAGDDQGEYVSATNTVTVRLGTGATAAAGGSLDKAASTVVQFDVKINAGFVGHINNQGVITAAGQSGAPPTNTPTGNGTDPGQPTGTDVGGCVSDGDCTAPTPHCDLTSTPHVCVQCEVDLDCGGATSGRICDAATKTCVDGCHTPGNGCPTGQQCATPGGGGAGMCVDCITDADCGGAMSGVICSTMGMCIPGCHTPGNDCPTGQTCSSTTSDPGLCTGCTKDSDCGNATSGTVCNTDTMTCVAGCHTPGNGCPTGDHCTSSDATIGTCVGCTKDSDCGGAMSGKVCDSATDSCIDGCRGTGGNGCPTGDHCTSTDGSIGMCAGCTTDADCGGAHSGQVCDDTHMCIAGCRGSGGNDCPDGQTCSSTDTSIGMCNGGAGGAGGGTSTNVGGGTSTNVGGGTSTNVGGGTSTNVGGGTSTNVGGGTSTNVGGGTSTNVGGGTSTNVGGAGGAGAASGGLVAEGGGCNCNTSGQTDGTTWLVGIAAAAVIASRRRRRDQK